MERVAGIEPAYLAWKATALPLSYTRMLPKSYSASLWLCLWWRRLDSNQRTHSERIYNPSPLTTRTLLHNMAEPEIGFHIVCLNKRIRF